MDTRVSWAYRFFDYIPNIDFQVLPSTKHQDWKLGFTAISWGHIKDLNDQQKIPVKTEFSNF